MKKLLHILCCCLVVVVNARNPGMKMRLERRVFTYANSVLTQILQDNLKSLTIPALEGKFKEFEFTVDNVIVSNVNISSSIDLFPDLGLIWKTSDSVMEVDGNFMFNIVILEDYCTFKAVVSGIDIENVITLSNDSYGRPLISVGSCSASIDVIDVKLQCELASLFNPFLDYLSDILKTELNSEFCNAVTTVANEAAKMITETLPLTFPIMEGFMLDYKMTGEPVIYEDFMETFHKGEIVWETEPSSGAPFTAKLLPESRNTESMISVLLSDYMFDTLMYQAAERGLLVRTLTAKDLPEDFASLLNTTCAFLCIGNILDGIGSEYPNSQVEINIKNTGAPDVKISKSGMKVYFKGQLELRARAPWSERTLFLIRFSTRITAVVDISAGNQTLHGEIKDTRLKLKTIKSNIGPVDDEIVGNIIAEAFKFLIPGLNEIGQQGFPLPVVPAVTLVDTSIAYAKNALVVSTDVLYTETGDWFSDLVGNVASVVEK